MISVRNEAGKRTNKLQLLKLERKDGGGVLVDTYYTIVLSGWKVGPTNDLPVDTQVNNKAYVQQFVPVHNTELLTVIVGVLFISRFLGKRPHLPGLTRHKTCY